MRYPIVKRSASSAKDFISMPWGWAVTTEEGELLGAFREEEHAVGFAELLQLRDAIEAARARSAAREVEARHHRGLTNRVYQIIRQELELEDDQEITDDKNIMEDLGADSLGVVELVLAFEEEFDIAIPDDIVETIPTVGDVVAYIKKAKEIV